MYKLLIVRKFPQTHDLERFTSDQEAGMFRRLLLFLLATSLLAADVASLHPIYTPDTVITNPQFAGLWAFVLSDFRIEPDGSNGYWVEINGERVFRVHLVRIGNETFADVQCAGKFDAEMPFHAIARLRFEADKLQVDWLGSDELEERMSLPGGPRHERVRAGDEDHIVLTASTPELQRFLLDSLAQPDAFGKHDTYERASPALRAKDLNERSWTSVTQPGRRDGYAEALELAEEAVKLVRDNPDYWNTLALARLRAGRFNDALAAIDRAGSLRSGTDPEDLAVRAMILHHLGLSVEAQTALERLRLLLADHKHCGDPDVLLLLRQTEEAVHGKNLK